MISRRRKAGAATRRAKGRERVGIVDIGSNSIRLVVFDRIARAPLLLFNEKVLCGLGRGLDESGRLNEEGVEFRPGQSRPLRAPGEDHGRGRLDLLATAAVRDASNGAAIRRRGQAALRRAGARPLRRGGSEVLGAWRALGQRRMPMA